MARPTVKDRNEWMKERHILTARVERLKQQIEDMHAEVDDRVHWANNLSNEVHTQDQELIILTDELTREKLIVNSLIGLPNE